MAAAPDTARTDGRNPRLYPLADVIGKRVENGVTQYLLRPAGCEDSGEFGVWADAHEIRPEDLTPESRRDLFGDPRQEALRALARAQHALRLGQVTSAGRHLDDVERHVRALALGREG